jgi:hypothetical protein
MKNKRREMMKTKIRYTVAAIAGLCLMSAMSRADLLLEGFEGSINGSAKDATVTFTNSTDFVTQGTQCAVVQSVTGWYNSAFAINVNGADIKNSETKRLLIDITAPVSSFSGGWGSDVFIVMQGDGFGWTAGPSQAVSGANKQTFTFDYSGFNLSGVPENPSWFEVNFMTAFGGPEDGSYVPGPIYVDNMRLEVIPEPATLGLVGLVGAGMLFIRRRFMI